VKRLLLLSLFTVLFSQYAEARHIAGGEMSYEYLGPGSGSNLKYRITLKLYRECYTDGGADLDIKASFAIYRGNSNVLVFNDSFPLLSTDRIELQKPGPCIDNPPRVCYLVGLYSFEIELPPDAQGYDVTYQRCCRIENITNVVNSGNSGATYTAHLPGTSISANAPRNSSPRFDTKDTVVICEGNPFFYDFGAVDIDGDALTYEFGEAYSGGDEQDVKPRTPSAPPYNALPYSFGFSFFRPMGPDVTLNPITGMVSGIAPNAGIYVITVVVVERRNGQIINRHRKDIHIKVAACTIAAADLQPEFVTCDGFTLTFQNRSSSSLIKTYYWDFGVPGNADTSNLERPTFTYSDTGVYRIRLITNRGLDCSDTAFALAKVFPGFFPAFQALDGCRNVPIQFRDQTTTAYGVVDYWKWFFGNPIVNQDTSRLRNPTYSYPNLGTYTVQLIVGSNKGCRDTIDAPLNILSKPSMQLTNDTLICTIDTLQLNAVGNGTFTWSPNYMISDINSSNPLVSPDVPTKYYATLTSAPGCVNIDSIFVDVRSFVTLNAGPDTTICLTDSVRFNINSDGLRFRWTPTAGMNNPNLKNPTVRPTGTTTYSVTGNIGKCATTDNIVVRTVPYPTVITRGDTTICYDDTTQIFASGGSRYVWTPTNSLSASDIPNPIAFPLSTTVYRVAVFDNLGCPKPSFDSVRINVIPPIPAFAGNDTAIVLGQPLQLRATGGSVYNWSPPIGLSNPNIANPIAILSNDITYFVRVSNSIGCFAYDTMNVKVFLTDPDIFVPTAFTPNGDGKNDKLKPIPVGVQSMDYFRVYNRYGQQVFNTTVIGEGWDGKINGTEQGTNTYTWYVQGTDYLGKRIFKKGTSTLIR
jgi:gliding motility-associated-like protein